MTCACGTTIHPTAKRCRACYLASWESRKPAPKHQMEPCACGRMMNKGCKQCGACRYPGRGVLLMRRIHKDETGCWLWTGPLDRQGYGRLKRFNGNTLAHRAVYTLLVGPITYGLTLDHLCRVRHCVNPDHLEPVTHAENCRRGVRARREEGTIA